jgi:hypothetical protein
LPDYNGQGTYDPSLRDGGQGYTNTDDWDRGFRQHVARMKVWLAEAEERGDSERVAYWRERLAPHLSPPTPTLWADHVSK